MCSPGYVMPNIAGPFGMGNSSGKADEGTIERTHPPPQLRLSVTTSSLSISSALSGAQCPICKATGLRAVVGRGQVSESESGNTLAVCNACVALLDWPACYAEVKPVSLISALPEEVDASDQTALAASTVPAAQAAKLEQVGWFGGRTGRGKFVLQIIGFCALEWMLVRDIGLLVEYLSVFAFPFILIFKVWLAKICVKRAHDFGWGSWTAIFSLPPLINVVWVLVLAVVPGSRSRNRYGPSLVIFEASPETVETSTEDRERDRARLVTIMDRSS